jgi:hypothetical protein
MSRVMEPMSRAMEPVMARSVELGGAYSKMAAVMGRQ